MNKCEGRGSFGKGPYPGPEGESYPTLSRSIIAALTPSQKSGLLMSLNVTTGTLFDKERLERGQSTANLSIVERILDESHEHVYQPKAAPGAHDDSH
jgi:hypothetical protein